MSQRQQDGDDVDDKACNDDDGDVAVAGEELVGDLLHDFLFPASKLVMDKRIVLMMVMMMMMTVFIVMMMMMGMMLLQERSW